VDYADFRPDACLINRYVPGAKLSLHQDKDEPDLRAPIVSVSLGLPAVFQFGGLKRNDPLQRLMLEHGDVVVWAGRPDFSIMAFYRLSRGIIRRPGRVVLTSLFVRPERLNKNKNYS
jgi:DNA alkylation damage repair protein AlkB